jgi:hypothetical protein
MGHILYFHWKLPGQAGGSSQSGKWLSLKAGTIKHKPHHILHPCSTPQDLGNLKGTLFSHNNLICQEEGGEIFPIGGKIADLKKEN